MIKIAVCDDEKMACELLNQKVLDLLGNGHCEIKCYYNASELLRAKEEFDLYFLDIQMPGLDGLALAKKLRESQNHGLIIFITAHSERVYDAFEVEAFDSYIVNLDYLSEYSASELILSNGERIPVSRLRSGG